MQLWVAEPGFEHHAELPKGRIGGLDVTVFLGALGSLELGRSPATAFSDLVGAELTAHSAGRYSIALAPSFEHVIFAVRGEARVGEALVGDAELRPGRLAYLAPGREELTIAAKTGAVLILLGGVPLGESLLMWWNFVARTPEEIERAVADWAAGRFGSVGEYAGEPMQAPPLRPEQLIRRP